MRIAFMGTPEFSVACLRALKQAGHDIVCVYTRAPRPAGRGQALQKTPVHEAAEREGIEVRTPRSLKSEDEQSLFAGLNLDLAVVVAYGLILPRPILEAPRLGCLNVHASILPRWRGAAPIQRAIMARDEESGVAIMRMDEGLDTGAVLSERRLAIPEGANAGWLHDRLRELGATLLVETIRDYAAGRIVPTPQAATGITYAHKITREDTQIRWTQTAGEVLGQILGLAPAPGAWCAIAGERVKILDAEMAPGHGLPGEVLDDRLTIACAEGAVRLLTLQRPGRPARATAEVLRGFPVPAGTRLGAEK
ncbi:MAG: methionyl-tRNA formyltransferase [Alphaproteobacteria bacterium]|nr:methionyl-tRNA formyltransferase [Alphaproteobacteria bacterium]